MSTSKVPVSGTDKILREGHVSRMDRPLKLLRQKSNLTIEQVAEAMGMSRGGYIKVERGERNMTLDFIERASRLFGVPKATLLNESVGSSGISEVTALGQQMLPVRVVGTVEAGTFREVDEFDQSEFEEIYDTPDPRFPKARRAAWNVAGDSMDALKPRPILPGDQVICVDFDDLEGRVPLRDGMVVVVERTRDGGQTREWSVKQVELYEGRTEFHPRSNNPKHRPIVVSHDLHADDGQSVQVRAVVRRVVNDIPM